jgi:tRNA(Ser,Leu) C12 N-acetylase TAN1
VANLTKNHKFVVMKDRLFKVLFPEKHQEIVELNKKVKSYEHSVYCLRGINDSQVEIIRNQKTDLLEIKDSAIKLQRAKTEEAECVHELCTWG